MRIILAEAIQRAGLNGDFQWRAGCPVQAGLDYRSELARILSTFGGEEKVTSVVEEPVLFLSLAHRLNALSPGSYLVYDLGGGSFDCAIAQVTAEGRMTVYASHGDPRLGGSTIDADLAQALDYRGLSHSLRIAKEQLSPTHTSESIDGNVNLSWNDLVKVLDKRKFFGWTCEAMRLAYISAKVIWKPDAGSSPISRIPSLRLGHMAEAFGKDIDAIILFGGSTKSPYFRDRLTETFGINKVITPDELIPAEIPDPELTGLSIGACYSADGGYPPLYVNRLPARVTLRDTSTGDQVGYEPYQHFVPNFSPARPFVSHRLPRRTGHRAKWELAVADADENVLESKLVDPGYQRTSSDPISSPALVIDTLGRIGIDCNGSRRIELENTPWQTDWQREALQSILEQERQLAASERQRVHDLVSLNQFGWQSGHA